MFKNSNVHNLSIPSFSSFFSNDVAAFVSLSSAHHRSSAVVPLTKLPYLLVINPIHERNNISVEEHSRSKNDIKKVLISSTVNVLGDAIFQLEF